VQGILKLRRLTNEKQRGDTCEKKKELAIGKRTSDEVNLDV